MSDKFQPIMQRPRLLALASALEISLVHLRRDDCGDWALLGRFGRVYALASSYQIAITGWETLGWNRCKREFAFATLTQDGDDEGAFTFDRDPTPYEAETIRHRVGLKKRREFDEATLAAMRERGKALAALRATQDAQNAAQEA